MTRDQELAHFAADDGLLGELDGPKADVPTQLAGLRHGPPRRRVGPPTGLQAVPYERLVIVAKTGIDGRSNGVEFTPGEARKEMRRRLSHE